MNFRNRKLGVLVAGLMGLAATLPASADLPGLEGDEWLGYFVGFKNKKYQFAITSQGKTTLRVIGEKGEPLNQMMTILVEFLVEETQPDGKSTAKYIKAESLESAQPATNKPQQMVIRGKVTGDAGFEAFVSEDRGVISLGGRLLDPGTLTNPTRFSIRLKVPKAYPYAKAAGNKKEEKEQKDKMKDDRLQLSWTDGKRVKLSADKAVDASSAEINGPGISAMQVEFSTYEKRKLELIASPNSMIKLSGNQAAPLHDGFTITWVADPAKDPDAKARLSFEVK